MAEFSNTTDKNGLIQHCERLTNLGDGVISGDTTLLKQFTAELNDAYDEVLPLVLATDRKWQWDDPEHTDFPIATTNIVSGQRDYKFTSDKNGNSVLKIISVAIKQSATNDDYFVIRPKDQSSPMGEDIIEDNDYNQGIPNAYDKFANSVILDPEPDYNATAGLKVTFQRTPDYFTSADTTQTPGVPSPFHTLLSRIAAYNWLIVNKSEESTLISRLENKINERKRELAEFMKNRDRDDQMVMRAKFSSPE